MLDIQIDRKSDGCVLIRLVGLVDIRTSPALRQKLHPLFTPDNKHIQMDLSGVTFMDSSGLATLVEGLQWSRLHSGRFVLAGLTEPVRDVFVMSKLDTVFEIADGHAKRIAAEQKDGAR